MGRPSAFLQSSGPLLPRYISIDRARGRVAASVQWPAQGARTDNPTHVVGFVTCVHSMQTREEAKSRLELRIFWVAGADEMLTRLQKRTRRAHCMPTVNSKPQAKFEIPSVLGLLD